MQAAARRGKSEEEAKAEARAAEERVHADYQRPTFFDLATAEPCVYVRSDRVGSSQDDGDDDDDDESFDDGAPFSCDVLLLSGAAIVDESMLTGESVPRTKEGAAAAFAEGTSSKCRVDGAGPLFCFRLAVTSVSRAHPWVLTTTTTSTDAEEGLRLQIESSSASEDADTQQAQTQQTTQDKNHALSLIYGGTKVLQTTQAAAAVTSKTRGKMPKVPSPPDGGCPAFVLRTAFHSAQGELVRKILFSSEARPTASNSREAVLFIAGLLAFAVAAVAFLLHEATREDGPGVGGFGFGVCFLSSCVRAGVDLCAILPCCCSAPCLCPPSFFLLPCLHPLTTPLLSCLFLSHLISSHLISSHPSQTTLEDGGNSRCTA